MKSKSQPKIFVLDSCLFIDDPDCMFKFGANEIVVPFTVICELDKHKGASGSKGEGARSALRNIYNISQSGKLSVGVKLENGAVFRVDVTEPSSIRTPIDLDVSDPDNAILAVAYGNRMRGRSETIVVTNDINLRIKAEALDMPTEKYENRAVKKADKLFSPYLVLEAEAEEIDTYMKAGYMDYNFEEKVYPNQHVLLRAIGSKQSALGRYNPHSGCIEKLKNPNPEPFNIAPKNLEQRFAMDALLDDSLKLVTLVGIAGTGKTFLTLACALQKVIHEGVYKKIVIARPIVTLGKAHELGFLPGSVQEKLAEWSKPITDNLGIMLDEEDKEAVDGMLAKGMIEFTPLAYIRGRSLSNSFIIIDEAQQLFPREVKALVTRVADNSKIVFTGDVHQIDHPYADEMNNGLSFLVEKFRSQSIAAHSTLTKCERSVLAGIAAEIL